MDKYNREWVGQQLGNYRLLSLLGRGGFAEVYLGEHVYLKSQAALKILHTVLAEEDTDSFVQEGQMLARLTHPHIVRVHDFALQDGTAFLVMEYAPNGTLRRRHPNGVRLPLETIVSYVQQVASALQYAHDQRLIHRDVKPENMLLGSHDEVLLSDFGLAMHTPSMLSFSTEGMPQPLAGTVPYLAPEQLQAKPRPASDQYALGVIVYEWLCGKHPFSGSPFEIVAQHLSMPPPSLCEQVHDLEPTIEAVVLRAMAKDPEHRFASVQEFAAALADACQPTQPLYLLPSVQTPSPATASEAPRNVELSKPLWKLPTTFTPLIGREQDVATISALLQRPEVRLLTLLGTGGIGKTRLSLQVATEMRGYFADGVCFVPLAAISDPALVIATIAKVLLIPEIGERPLFEQAQMYLRDKHLLLLLDNFEQVASAAPQIEELLATCLQLQVIVTSRVRLRLLSEHIFPVPPLALPDLTQLPEGQALAQYPAVALFRQHAQTLMPTFDITETNARALAEVCVRLDGLPLAIELAAARIRVLPPRALLARLPQQLQLLTSGAQTLPLRHQTLRNTLKWSYDLLDAAEQRLFRWLSVFVGGCMLDAIEVICAAPGDEAVQVLDRAASLIDKSLLLQIEQTGEEPRFRVLQTVREYGLECLREGGEAEVSRRAHAEYYLTWAEQAKPHLKGTQQIVWLEQLEREQENLRAALQWLIEQAEVALALRFCEALWWFWYVRGHWSEGRRWLEAVLGLPDAGGQTVARAKALYHAGTLASRLGDLAAARSSLEASVALYQELGDKRGLAQAMSELGWSLYLQSDLMAARTLLEESMLLAREVGDRWILADALLSLGMFMHYQGDSKVAHGLLEESETLSRALGDTHALAFTLTFLGRTALPQSNLMQAAAYVEESATLARSLGYRRVIAEALYLSGYIALLRGEFTQAAGLFEECLVPARSLGYQRVIAEALYLLGYVVLQQGEFAQAAIYAQEALTLFRELGIKGDSAMALVILGEIRFVQGDLAQATAFWHEGLLLAKEAGHKLAIGLTITAFAKIATTRGQFLQAAQLFGAAELWLDLKRGVDPAQRALLVRMMESVRTQLGEQVFVATWAEGRGMTLEGVLAMVSLLP